MTCRAPFPRASRNKFSTGFYISQKSLHISKDLITRACFEGERLFQLQIRAEITICVQRRTPVFSRSRYGGSDLLNISFNQRCTGVDLKSRSVTFSTCTDNQSEVPTVWDKSRCITRKYDLLVGADGVHSVVRQGIMQSVRR
jgi:hypothetical protein